MQKFSAQIAKPNIALTSKRIFELVKGEMKLVEAEFERRICSNIQVVRYLGEYLRLSGGKRVRPSLLLLSNKAAKGDARSKSVIKLAAVMEILHTATLVHDDVIDNALIRRNNEAVNAKFGNQTAVLMGDWLYMSAFEISLKERNLEILDVLTKLTRKMTEGELIQLTMIGRTDISEFEYFDILQRKTAHFFSACCEIGALLANVDQTQQKALRSYGKNLGTAFQLTDDLLDFTASTTETGKASGADLLEGKLTLPLILLRKLNPSAESDLEQIIKDGKYRDASRKLLLKELKVYGTLRKTKKIAHDFAEKARKSLEVLPKTKYRLALEEITNYVIERSE